MVTKDEIIEMACQAFGGIIKKEERNNFIAFAKLVEAKKRTWVGLTDEEIQECLKGLPTQTIDVYARRIETKIKDKNT